MFSLMCGCLVEPGWVHGHDANVLAWLIQAAYQSPVLSRGIVSEEKKCNRAQVNGNRIQVNYASYKRHEPRLEKNMLLKHGKIYCMENLHASR